MSARQNWEIDSTNDVLVNSTYNFRLRAALINYFSGNINLALNFSKIRNIANIIFCTRDIPVFSFRFEPKCDNCNVRDGYRKHTIVELPYFEAYRNYSAGNNESKFTIATLHGGS